MQTVFRKDNLELRWRLPATGRSFLEIIRWVVDHKAPNGEYCYTVALWEDTSEQAELRFIGSRPFDILGYDHDVFWRMAKYGDAIANAMYKLKEER